MTDQPPPSPLETNEPPRLTAEQMAEKLQRQQFEAMIEDPAKLAEAQEKLARQAIAEIRRNAPPEEEAAPLPLGRILGAAAVCVAIYMGLLGAAGRMEKTGNLMELGLNAFAPFLIVLSYVLAGMLVGRGTKMPIIYASTSGLVTGVALVVTQAAMGFPASKGQILWILAPVAFFALGSLSNAVKR